MAVIHIKVGGTKSASGAGDYASTPDDWSLANCYDNLQQVGQSAISGTPSTFIQAGDVVIFEDEDHDLSQTRIRDISVDGTVTFRSRSGNRDTCRLVASDGTESYLLLINNDSSNVTKMLFKDLTITASVTLSGINKPMIYIQNETGDVTFDNVRFTGLNADTATSTAALSAVIYNRVNGTGATARTLEFRNNCLFDDITCIYGNGGAIIRNDADATVKVAAGETLTFQNVSNSADVDGSGSVPFGIIYVEEGTLSNAGKIVFDTVSQEAVHLTSGVQGMISTEDGGEISGGGVFEGKNCTVRAGRPACIFVHVQGANSSFDIGAIKLKDSTNTWLDLTTSGTSAGAFLAQNDVSTDASDEVGYVEAIRVSSRFGPAAYGSGGGGWTIKRIYAKDCRCVEGVVYSGGDGDTVADAIFITGTRYYSENLLTGESFANDSEGMDIFLFLNASSGNRNKTATFNQVTVTDSQPGALASVRISNNNTSNSLTAEMNNAMIQSGCNNDFEIGEGASATLDLTLVNCVYQTMLDEHGGTGTFTNTDPVIANVPMRSAGRLPFGSRFATSGTKWWTAVSPPLDVTGEPLPPRDISIGAFQDYRANGSALIC